MFIRVPKQHNDLQDSINRISKKQKTLQEIDIFNQLQQSVPDMEKELSEIIEQIVQYMNTYNVLQILEYFGMHYCFSIGENPCENLDDSRNFKLDFLISLAMTCSNNNKQDTNQQVFDDIEKLINKLQDNILLYLVATSTHNSQPNFIKFQQIVNSTFMRGDSYLNHKILMCRELFCRYDEIILKEYNINSNQLIDILLDLASNHIKNIDIQRDYFTILKDAHKDFNFINQLEQISPDKLSYFLVNHRSSNEYYEIDEKLKKIESESGVFLGDNIFKLNISKMPKNILESLSMSFGDNLPYTQGRISRFPTNESLIYEKPILKFGNEYYCFNPLIIHYNLHSIMEKIILSTIPESKQQKLYYSKKGEYLEDKSIELIEKILPNCQSYKNLKYAIDDEVDGLIIYDNNILIVESKSNKFTDGARRGNIEKIKTDTKNIIEKAYQQAVRTKNFILSNEISEFRDKNKKVVCHINRLDINNIYLINISLDALTHITSNLSSLKEFGFVQGDEWIWSVYLNDLRIISEILESPSEFLLYLERRLRFNDYPQISTAEEIDIFGYFLQTGLYFDDMNIPKDNFTLRIGKYSDDIDNYFYSLECEYYQKFEKPFLFYKDKKPVRWLVKEIEKTGIKDFTQLTKSLLSLNGNMQELITNQFDLMAKGVRNDFHAVITEIDTGVYLVRSDSPQSNYQHVCELYAYFYKVKNWFVIFVNDDGFVKFQKFYFENTFNRQLEIESELLKSRRMQEYRHNISEKIGRNDLCPCNSGKKYKKCCLNSKW